MSTPKRVLPAVMLSMTVGSALMSGGANAASATSTQLQQGATVAPAQATATATLPAVLGQRAPATYPVPDSLRDYTNAKAIELALWQADPDPTHCATIGGSDSSWDQSDCM